MLEQVSDQWRHAGLLLGLSQAALKNIKQKSDEDVERFEHVLTYWIESNGHLEYPLTWDGVCELLRDIDRDTAAEKLKQALSMMSL